MRSLSPRQSRLWLSGATAVQRGKRVGPSPSRCNQAARWFMGACLFILLAYSRTLPSQVTAPKGPEDTADSAFYAPYAVAVDCSGNIYVADTKNQRVLKETLSGGSYTQSTVGTGLRYPGGAAQD